MKETEKQRIENQNTVVTLSELNERPGRIVRDVLRTQQPATITEYGQEVAEIRPIKEHFSKLPKK